MKQILLILFLLKFSFCIAQSSYYTEPLKIPMYLSASFAELRLNHFHSGIDIKTQGATGLPVNSVADGYISRIVVSPVGYGHAIYIDHPNGTTSVYGHLSRFRDDIAEYVKNMEYERKSFRVDLQIPKNKFPVFQNEIIAYSGNTGSSGGPHLHFEIRDTKSEEPLNPLSFNFPVADHIAPKIYALEVAPLDENSHVDFEPAKKFWSIVFYDGNFHLKGDPIIPVYGNIGFAVQANDYFDDSHNRCGIYSMQLKIDGELYFSQRLDRFSFDETRAVNSYIDYSEYMESKRRYQKSWVDPGNSLDIYNYTRGNGSFLARDGNIHIVKIELKDTYGNTSSLQFRIESKFMKPKPEVNNYTKFFSYNNDNDFSADNIRLDLPEGCLYDNLKFVHKSKPGGPEFYSDLHIVHTDRTPLHKSIELKIRPENLPDNLQQKVLLVKVDTLTGDISAAGGKYSWGWVTSKISTFGNYALAVDTVPPRIVPLSIANHSTLKESNRIRFRISDDLSGINKIEGYLDGKWALFEYDPRYNLITHYFDAERFELKKRHQFVLDVTDYKGNKTTYEASFWK